MKLFDEVWMDTPDDEGNQLLKDMLSAINLMILSNLTKVYRG